MSNLLYRVSVGLSALEKYVIGHHWLLRNCWRTAPTAESETSVMRHVGALGIEWMRRVELTRYG